ncbi:hypothetical protein XENORESO_009498 [Xenotaenia resolanae]|uniref:Uncharacterized protein n=1 Tax=Xenotaenia resolanae TaxID=208358 RepID=A0ABV0VPX2_9TELE
MVEISASTFYGSRGSKWSIFFQKSCLLLNITFPLQYESLHHNLVKFEKCTMMLTLSKHKFYPVSSVGDSGTNYFHASGNRGLSEAEMISKRIVKGELDIELSGDDDEEGQIVEQKGEGSEEPEQDQSEDIRQPIWMKSNV